MPALRILALGDSYTIGEGVDRADRWPERLAAALGGQASVETVAVTGWTLADLADGLADADLDPPYDLVTLLIGVNDQYEGTPPDALHDAYAERLRDAVRLAGGAPERVVAVSVPDWGPTAFGAADPRGPAGIGPEIDALNDMERRAAQAAGVAWVDVTAVSREQGGWTVADGLHPDARAYRAWAERVLPAARRALGTPRADGA